MMAHSRPISSNRDNEDPFEEDIVFDQAGLLNNTTKINSAIRRVSSGKCVLFAKTLGLCGAFFGLGLSTTIPGPTFLSPVTDLESNVSPISNIYTARSIGYLIGSASGGLMFDRFNRLFLLFMSLLLTSFFIALAPWCNVLWLLQACMVILGIAMGFLDTGGNVLCLDLWGRNSGPFMQGLHFSFSLGAFIAPLLAAPFLEPTVLSTNIAANSIDNTSYSFNISFDPQFSNISRKTRELENKSLESYLISKNKFNFSKEDIINYYNTTPISFITSRPPKPKPSITDATLFSPSEKWDKHKRTTPPKEAHPFTTNSPSNILNITNENIKKMDSEKSVSKESLTSMSSEEEFRDRTYTSPNIFINENTTFSQSEFLKQKYVNEMNDSDKMFISTAKEILISTTTYSSMEERKDKTYKILELKKSNDDTSMMINLQNNSATSEDTSSENNLKETELVENKDLHLESITFKPEVHHRFKPGTYDNDIENVITIFDIFANRFEKYGFNKIQITYFIVGFFVFLISLVFLGFLCHNPRDPKSKQEDSQGTKKITNVFVQRCLVLLMSLFLLLYVGIESSYGQLILAFAIEGNLKLSQATGSNIAIVFWGSFAAMRFCSIFCASGVPSMMMLIFNFIFCTLGTLILAILANISESAIWIGTTLLSIGLASMFPSGILWIERYIHVTNKIASFFVIGVTLGQIICPITVYHLMVVNPKMLMYFILVINILCILIFTSLWWLVNGKEHRYCIVNNNGYQLANQNEEEDMVDLSPSPNSLAFQNSTFEQGSLLNGLINKKETS